MQRFREGLEIDPEYENLLTLNEELTTMLAAQQRQADIADALRVAADYQAQGHAGRARGNQRLRCLSKRCSNWTRRISRANQGLESILTGLLNEVEQVILTGDLELAGNQAQELPRYFRIQRRVNEVQTQIAAKAREDS